MVKSDVIVDQQYQTVSLILAWSCPKKMQEPRYSNSETVLFMLMGVGDVGGVGDILSTQTLEFSLHPADLKTYCG